MLFREDKVARADAEAIRKGVGFYRWTHDLVEITGKDALEVLQKIYISDISKVAVGRSKYTASLDENGEIVMKRGKPVADAALRDTENVPLVQDIDAYFAREVLPYAPDAWIDKSKTKVGYEIPMTRYFYEYQPPEPVDDIVERIQKLEREIADSLNTLFHKEG